MKTAIHDMSQLSPLPSLLLNCVATVAFCCICTSALAQNATQHPNLDPVQRSLIAERSGLVTLAGNKAKWIASVPCDPFMTPDEESRLFEELRKLNTDPWGNLTIMELVQELSKTLPILLAQEELDLLGIDAETPIPDQIPPGPLGARLDDALIALDLQYCIRAGRVHVTSRDAADNEPQLRIYNITPLVRDHKALITSLVSSATTSISPDSWLQNGGTASMGISQIPNPRGLQTLLVVSANTRIQLAVDAYLNRTAQLGSSN